MCYLPNILLWVLLVSLSSFSTCFSHTINSEHPSAVDHLSSSNLVKRRLLAASSSKSFNVDSYGAKPYGGEDSSEAFKKAWEDACAYTGKAVIEVPKNKIYHIKPVTFSGPCKSQLTLKVYGTVKASVRLSDYDEDRRHWIMFQYLNNFTVEGGGFINGNGRKWWQRSCKVDKSRPCTKAPTAMTFYKCNNLKVADVVVHNAQQMHISLEKCKNVEVSNLLVAAPETSPNTDGIHVSGTENILIKNSVIRTGDDCISVVSGSKDVHAFDIVCGPGHGISIGSLGADGSTDYVSNVLVNKARISGTTNGVRIKTWQGGSGYAKNITFENILMRNVTNPIIIDQNYCDQEDSCPVQASAVEVSNVVYKNIKGTSASEVAVKFECSKSVPCTGILLQDVNLMSLTDEDAKASFANVKLTKKGQVSV